MRRVVALLFLAALAGCVDEGTVRAALVEEALVLDDNAPASARERTAMTGCGPGVYDVDEGRIHLRAGDDDLTPDFALLWPNGSGEYVALTAKSGGGPRILRGLSGGSSGSWGMDAPFGSGPDLARFSWDKHGASFAGQDLPEGEVVPFGWRYNATWDNVTFGVEHSFAVTYLGRVPYDESYVC